MSEADQSVKRKRAYVSNALRLKIYERDGRKCALCGRETRFSRSHYDTPFDDGPVAGSVDHIIPTSRGGTSGESNLRWTCRSCNCARGNRS